MTHTPKTVFSALAEAIRVEDQDAIAIAVDAVIAFYGITLAPEPDELRGVMTYGSREDITNSFVDLLQGTEGFDNDRFIHHATGGFKYPTTLRRSWVALADAIRAINNGEGVRGMLSAIANLHMDEVDRYVVLTTYMANIPHRPDFSEVHRHNLASSLARLLDGREKFDVARFIHHATSDSVADNDSEEGKWSFNRTHQAEAQKTTIESSSGEAVEL